MSLPQPRIPSNRACELLRDKLPAAVHEKQSTVAPMADLQARRSVRCWHSQKLVMGSSFGSMPTSDVTPRALFSLSCIATRTFHDVHNQPSKLASNK